MTGLRYTHIIPVKLHLENLPASLHSQRDTLRRCLEAMDAALPIEQVILFGSHARGEAGLDSDVDLCLVANGAERQLEAASEWRAAMRPVWPRPPFTEFLSGELRSRNSELMDDIDPIAKPLAEACVSGRYPGFDLVDPDWPTLRGQLDAITALAAKIRGRLAGP